MEQNKIVGKQVAVAKLFADEDELRFQLVVDPIDLEMMGVGESSLVDCIKEIEGMGSLKELAIKFGDPNASGYHPGGLVVRSKSDDRVSCSVEFGGHWLKDSQMQSVQSVKHDATLKFFVDNHLERKEASVPQREVAPEELKIHEDRMSKFQPVMEAIKSSKAYSSDPLYEQVMKGAEEMRREESRSLGGFDNLDDVDFFGLPKAIVESENAADVSSEKEKNKSVSQAKDMKEISPEHEKDPTEYSKEVEKKADDCAAPKEMKAGDVLAKPASEVGKEHGEKAHDQSKVKVGEPGDDHGDHVEGKGKSDDQQKDLPAAKVKLGKPGDDHGKVVGEARSLRGNLPAPEVKLREGKAHHQRASLSRMSKKKVDEGRKLVGVFAEDCQCELSEKLISWKRADNYSGEDYSDYYVAGAQHRDSDALQRSNFRATLAKLGGEDDENVIVARSGHWAVGWVEQILVKKSAKDKVKILKQIMTDLENYPIVDEDDFHEEEEAEIRDNLKSNLSDFVSELQKILGKEEISSSEEKDLKKIATELYRWRVDHSGIDDAWVSKDYIEDMSSNDWADLERNIKSPLVAELKAKMQVKESVVESDPSLKPPKRWFGLMTKKVKGDDKAAIVGSIWSKLDDKKKAEIRAREGKKYGPAPKTEAVVSGSEVTVYDNGGKSLDRYTVVIDDGEEKSFFGMSANPVGPQSFNQYLGSDKDGYEEGPHLGKKLKTIPAEIQKAVEMRVTTESAQAKSPEGSEDPQAMYDKMVREPEARKLQAKPAKVLRTVELTDDNGEVTGEIKIKLVSDESHKSMVGKHVLDPSDEELEDAIQDAAKDGFETIWVHRSPMQNNSKDAPKMEAIRSKLKEWVSKKKKK